MAIVLLLVTFVMPKTLTTPNYIWFKFGMAIGSITSPIVMALVYFITVLPTGLIMRLLGRDLLNQKLDKNAKSYWIVRQESVGSMRNQF